MGCLWKTLLFTKLTIVKKPQYKKKVDVKRTTEFCCAQINVAKL
jgi:hypothetical protein